MSASNVVTGRQTVQCIGCGGTIKLETAVFSVMQIGPVVIIRSCPGCQPRSTATRKPYPQAKAYVAERPKLDDPGPYFQPAIHTTWK